MRPSQGFWGTGEQGHSFQGNKGQILRGTKTLLGSREHKKTNFRFWGNRGTSQFISGEEGNRWPPEGPFSVHRNQCAGLQVAFDETEGEKVGIISRNKKEKSMKNITLR